MALQIETGTDNPILRQVSEAVTQRELPQLLKHGKQMLKYIKNSENGGVGLAAPQTGLSKRMIVVSLLRDWEDENFPTLLMFNPEILEHSQEIQHEFEEGCLSVPNGERGYVERWLSIKLRYHDEKMKEKTLKLSGLSAVIIQHEIDHLNGVLYTDNLVK